MRLNTEQIQSIHHHVARHLGEQAQIWLFGSRLDDSKRGGDVDLYVETDLRDTLLAGIRCKIELEDALDLPVDLIIRQTEDRPRPIDRIAKVSGILL